MVNKVAECLGLGGEGEEASKKSSVVCFKFNGKIGNVYPLNNAFL